MKLDHVQLAMPRGGEDRARQFYGGVLGMREVEKPKELQSRGGCWFVRDDCHVHLGVDEDFVPARKAHPAFLVSDLDALEARLTAAGASVTKDDALRDVDRSYVADPFGNRIELIRAGRGFRER